MKRVSKMFHAGSSSSKPTKGQEVQLLGYDQQVQVQLHQPKEEAPSSSHEHPVTGDSSELTAPMMDVLVAMNDVSEKTPEKRKSKGLKKKIVNRMSDILMSPRGGKKEKVVITGSKSVLSKKQKRRNSVSCDGSDHHKHSKNKAASCTDPTHNHHNTNQQLNTHTSGHMDMDQMDMEHMDGSLSHIHHDLEASESTNIMSVSTNVLDMSNATLSPTQNHNRSLQMSNIQLAPDIISDNASGRGIRQRSTTTMLSEEDEKMSIRLNERLSMNHTIQSASSNSPLQQQRGEEQQQRSTSNPRTLDEHHAPPSATSAPLSPGTVSKLQPCSKDTYTRQSSNGRRKKSLAQDDHDEEEQNKVRRRKKKHKQKLAATHPQDNTPIFETETDSIAPLDMSDIMTAPTKLIIDSASHGLIETTMTKEDLLSPLVTKVVKRLPNGNLFISAKAAKKGTAKKGSSTTPKSKAKAMATTTPKPKVTPSTTTVSNHQRRRSSKSDSANKLPPTGLPSSLPLDASMNDVSSNSNTMNDMSNSNNNHMSSSNPAHGSTKRRSNRRTSRDNPKTMISEIDSIDLAMAEKVNKIHGTNVSQNNHSNNNKRASPKQRRRKSASGGMEGSSRRRARTEAGHHKKTPRRKTASHYVPVKPQDDSLHRAFASEMDSVQLAACPRSAVRVHASPSSAKKQLRRRKSGSSVSRLMAMQDNSEPAIPVAGLAPKKTSRRRKTMSHIADNQKGGGEATPSTLTLRGSKERRISRDKRRESQSTKKVTRKRRKSKEALRRVATAEEHIPVRAMPVGPATPKSSSGRLRRRTSFSGDGTDFTDDPSFLSPKTLMQRLQIPVAPPPEKQNSQMSLGYRSTGLPSQDSHNGELERKAKSNSPPVTREKIWAGQRPARTRSNAELFQQHFVVASPSPRRRTVALEKEDQQRLQVCTAEGSKSDHSSKAPSHGSAPAQQSRRAPTRRRRAQSMSHAFSIVRQHHSNERKDLVSVDTSKKEEEMEPSPTSVVENGIFALDFAKLATPQQLNKASVRQGTPPQQQLKSFIQQAYGSPGWETAGNRAERRKTLTCDGRDKFEIDTLSSASYQTSVEVSEAGKSNQQPLRKSTSEHRLLADKRASVPLPSLASFDMTHEEDPEDESDSVGELTKFFEPTKQYANNRKGISDACDSVVLSKALKNRPMMHKPQSMPLPSLASFDMAEEEDSTVLSEGRNSPMIHKPNMAEETDEDEEEDHSHEDDSVGELNQRCKTSAIARHFNEQGHNSRNFSDACDSVVLSKALKNRPTTRHPHACMMRRRSLGDNVIEDEQDGMLNSWIGDHSPQKPRKTVSVALSTESEISSQVGSKFANACDSVVLNQFNDACDSVVMTQRKVKTEAKSKKSALARIRRQSLGFIKSKQAPPGGIEKQLCDTLPRKPPRRSYSFESHFSSATGAKTIDASLDFPIEDAEEEQAIVKDKEEQVTRQERVTEYQVASRSMRRRHSTHASSFDSSTQTYGKLSRRHSVGTSTGDSRGSFDDMASSDYPDSAGSAIDGKFRHVKSCDSLELQGVRNQKKQQQNTHPRLRAKGESNRSLGGSMELNYLHQSMPARKSDGTSPWGDVPSLHGGSDHGNGNSLMGEDSDDYNRWSSSY